MKLQAHKTIILTIILAFLVPLAHSEDERCHLVKYLKHNVSDKPDLIVKEELYQKLNSSDEFFTDHYSEFHICELSSNKSEIQGKFIGSTRVASPDMEYDSRAGVIYQYMYGFIANFSLVTGAKNLFIAYPIEDIDSISLDWVTKNMYISQRGKIRVFNVLENQKPPTTILSGLEETYTKVYVFPNEGYLIVETRDTIIRHNQDGSNPLVLYNSTTPIYDLALDHYENNIYWLESLSGEQLAHQMPKRVIRYTNLTGGEVHTFQITGDDTDVLPVYSHLAIDDKYVYFRKGALTKSHLFRARKSSGEFDKDFDVFENSQSMGANQVWEGWFKSILIKSAHPQRIVERHPCLVDNGGCKRYCVAVPSNTTEGDRLSKRCIDTNLV